MNDNSKIVKVCELCLKTTFNCLVIDFIELKAHKISVHIKIIIQLLLRSALNVEIVYG